MFPIPPISVCDGDVHNQIVFYSPVWDSNQLKVTFLPILLQCAVENNCRIIILIENHGDWPAPSNDLSRATGLTLGDVSLDVVLESESRDRHVTVTWLRCVDKRTQLPLWSAGPDGGFRCCLVRICDWKRFEAPDKLTWNAYRKAIDRYVTMQ